jgi:hypothetical protein
VLSGIWVLTLVRGAPWFLSMSARRRLATLRRSAEEIQVKIGSGINSILPIRQRPDGPLYLFRSSH